MSDYLLSLLYYSISSLVILCLLLRAVADCFRHVYLVRTRSDLTPQQESINPENDTMTVVVINHSVDAGRFATSTLAMSYERNDENDSERRRRVCCNSPLPACLEDFLHVQVLTEHDIEIMGTRTRSGTEQNNCSNIAPTRSNCDETTHDGENKEWASSARDDVAKMQDGNHNDNNRHENLHDEQHEYNNNNNSNNDEFLVCSICLADMKPGDQFVVTRQCHHVFHAACMEAWLFSATPCKQQQHPRRGSRTNNTSTRNNHQCCPNCRAEILPFASTMTTTTTTP